MLNLASQDNSLFIEKRDECVYHNILVMCSNLFSCSPSHDSKSWPEISKFVVSDAFLLMLFPHVQKRELSLSYISLLSSHVVNATMVPTKCLNNHHHAMNGSSRCLYESSSQLQWFRGHSHERQGFEAHKSQSFLQETPHLFPPHPSYPRNPSPLFHVQDPGPFLAGDRWDRTYCQ